MSEVVEWTCVCGVSGPCYRDRDPEACSHERRVQAAEEKADGSVRYSACCHGCGKYWAEW